MSTDFRPGRLLRWLFTWNGTVSSGQYFVAGSVLLVIKYGIDHRIASLYGQPCQVWNYFLPTRQASPFHTPNQHMYLALWAVALPFFWTGIALTMRRLRSAGRRTAWVFLFFMPVVNLAFFLTLSVLPEVANEDGTVNGSRWRGAALGIQLSVAFGLLLVLMSVGGLGRYGSGLFLGVPFAVGFMSATVFNYGGRRTLGATVGIAMSSVLFLGLVLFGARYEGLICLLMALPLALPLTLAGAVLAWRIQADRERVESPPTMAAWLLVLPLAMFVEHAVNPKPPVLAVTTAVEINAPAEKVWRNVVTFPPLAPPQELLFRAGIAYPMSGVIHGHGVGAVRYCRFSTGDFVEPITTWDAGHLLAFNVAAQPMAMRELSPWRVTPLHIEANYMRSRRGQFLLSVLPGGRTRLEGTTWYQNYFWPQPYWRMWSDYIVHRIHMRVLLHVKAEAERASAPAASSGN